MYELFYNISWLPMEKIMKELFFFNILLILAYLQIDATMIGLYTILACLDFTTGLMKGWRCKSLSSDRAGIGVAKKVGILIIILSLAILFRMGGIDGSITISIFIGMFAIGEVISITGNIYEVSTGKKAPEFEAMDYITLFILEWLKLRLDRVIRFVLVSPPPTVSPAVPMPAPQQIENKLEVPQP